MPSEISDSLAVSLLEEACGDTFPAYVPEFAHSPGTRVVFGEGAVVEAGKYARSLGGQRVLIVTDRGVADAGHLDRVVESLAAAGVEWSAYMGVQENPTTDTVAECVAAARKVDADLLIGLGGGSSMDTAKGCNFILTNGGEMRDYWGSDRAAKPMLPLVAIPTTSGTGSECQSYALISDAVSHAKMACGDRKAAARVALLDPLLTLSQPPRVTRLTGIDAIAHAVESAVCTKANEISFNYSRAAFAVLCMAFPRVLQDATDLRGRAGMQLGAALAGTAIENAMLGAAHSAANPLTARFGTTHGEAVGMMLPHVVTLNGNDPIAAQAYARLAAVVRRKVESLPDFLTSLLMEAGLPLRMPSGLITEELLPIIGEEAARQWTAQFNPVAVAAGHFEELYAEVM